MKIQQAVRKFAAAQRTLSRGAKTIQIAWFG
jgi:hypothetical protein